MGGGEEVTTIKNGLIKCNECGHLISMEIDVLEASERKRLICEGIEMLKKRLKGNISVAMPVVNQAAERLKQEVQDG
jgi:hypothetical protein